MKKTLFILAVAGGIMLTSCDPQKAEGEFEKVTMTSESLLKGAEFAQFDAVKDDDGNINYVPSETGNYIQYNLPEVSAVNIYYIKNGAKKTLSYGRSGGMFYYVPSRGSDEVQTLYFSFVNTDGTEVVAEKQFTLKVAQALDPEVKILVSNKGTKKWRWMPTSANGGAVWGNAGYIPDAPQEGGIDINGAWWGCGTIDGQCGDTFEGQTNHAGKRWPDIKGECYALSYMEFNEDGSLNAYSNEGILINEGSFAIKDYNNNEIVNAENFSRGTLETSEGAILWPFMINGEGFQPNNFIIRYLDPSRMILIYPSEGAESWRETTWWSFMSDSDPEGVLSSHEWHWRPTNVNGGAVWGNMGYVSEAQGGGLDIAGAWWGCGPNDGECPDTFAGQMNHAGPSYVEGEEYLSSKMVFNEDEASITVYGKDGNQIRSGSFAVDMTPDPASFTIGTLTTSAGAILWPFQINGKGFEPTNFEIRYLGTDAVVLAYPSEGEESWRETTWWSFGK